MTPPFDPDAAATGEGIYGLPDGEETSAVILIPVPWDATTSYARGTAAGPESILQASRQVDLFDREVGRPYESGIALLPEDPQIRAWNQRAGELAAPVIAAGGVAGDAELARRAQEVNQLGTFLNDRVREVADHWLQRGRLVGVIGGEHSVPFGCYQALARRHPTFGILQIDAHCDLRAAYEGLRWSHASIFHNALEEIPQVQRLVQVGIRDYSGGEDAAIEASQGRVRTWFDNDLRRRLQDGEPWTPLAREIVDHLPPLVHVSVDIDGLDPSLCPHTGTPVPGGLSMVEAVSLFRHLIESGRRIIGFDLCEVAPDPSGTSEWDGNVAARLLYKLIGYALRGA